ncbi:MAG: tetratricopeptide repeat protein [Candidatus Thorarchaeota archaeon]
MDEAKDYGDFAEILCNRVCTESTTSLAIYFAYFFAYNQGNFYLIDRLHEAGKYTVLAKPMRLIVQARRGIPADWNDFQKTLSESLEITENDWIACHIYVVWRRLAEPMYTESSTDSGTLSILESKIESDSEFSFFRSDLLRLKARKLGKERSINDALKMYNLAIIQAKKHDNLLFLSLLLAEKANLVKRTNVDEALSILELQREVVEELGYAEGIGLNHHHLGHIAMARGEFDLALHHQKRHLEIRSKLGHTDGYLPALVAQLYNMMGDGNSALEMVTSTGQQTSRWNILMVLIQEAWAMVHLDRIDEAETSISKAKELVLKSDDEVRLGLTYFVEGVIEKYRRDFISASYTLETALRIFERYYSHAYLNMTLIHLTDIEIESFSFATQKGKLGSSGSWMDKLLDHVTKNDLPGTKAQSEILRAKFLFKQGQAGQSKKIIKGVLKTAKSPNMQYLENLIKMTIPELST